MSLLAASVPHRVDALSGGVWVEIETYETYYAALAFARDEFGAAAIEDGHVEITPVYDLDER